MTSSFCTNTETPSTRRKPNNHHFRSSKTSNLHSPVADKEN